MDKYKHNLSFRLEKRKKDGELIVVNVPILADITFGTTRFYYSTGFRVNADQWIDKANGIKVQRVDTKKNKQQASEINAKLGKIKIAVDKVFKRLEFEEVDPPVENVRARLKREMGEEKPERKNLVQFYEDYIIYKTQRAAKKWSKSTEKKHRTILNHLKEYKPGMYFQDVTKENLDGFVNFLVNKKHHTNAYISKNIRDLCCFLNWAFNSGFNTNTAYQKYNPNLDGLKANDKTNIIALSSEEFLRIYNLEIEKEYLKRVRNLFCFCCSTGMRYSDAQNLKWVDIRGDKIVFVAIKTRQEL
ncbi:MAG: site-specific integrase, partial [Clostridia bacterium]|nr:site-specific integrase [Clostridia bacterium]